MVLARSPGAATLRAPALALRAAAYPGPADGRQTPEAIRRCLEHVGQDGGPPAFEGVAGRVAFVATEIR